MSEGKKADQIQTCDQCGNHCPVDALQCGKGYKYFGMEDTGCNDEHSRGRGHHHHRDGLAGLIQRCGRFVHHTDEEEEILFQALTEEERAALQELLGKLDAGWRARSGEEAFSRGHHPDRSQDGGRRHKHEGQDK